jgi:molybdopterin converting factor small subunit
VLQQLGVPADLERVALVNGTDAPAERPLQPGDVLTVFPPLAGGSR